MDGMASDWTELYRPTVLDEVVGNPKAVRELRNWAAKWEARAPQKKAVVLMGVPGIGKTSAALALANEFGWGVVEMNASDQRNADSIRNVATRGALTDTFSAEGDFLSSKKGFRKLIILDEADNVFGQEDRGGIPAIIELIRHTQQPIILIVNDFYELKRRSSYISSNVKQIKFKRIRSSTMERVLGEIARSEGFRISDRALSMVVENSNGDMRAAIRDLQSVATGKKEVDEKDVIYLQNRHLSKSIWNLLEEILRGTPSKARSQLMDVDETPDSVLLWVDENLPSDFRDPRELARGYEMLSRADVFLGRVYRRQYYGLWSYASDLMTYGVSASKNPRHRPSSRFRFPSYLSKMSRSKGRRATKKQVSLKIGDYCHTSANRTREDILNDFMELFKKNKDFRIEMYMKLDLTQSEAAFLLDEKVDSHAVKHLMSQVEKVKMVKETEGITSLDELEEEPQVDEEGEEEYVIHQSSLLEY